MSNAELALLRSIAEEMKPLAAQLRRGGWPAEAVVYRNSPIEGEGPFGIKLVVPLHLSDSKGEQG